ncbi:MAG TPA: glycine cleavage system protein GcvH, partial [Dehalococcoidia bacterium]|nr:glycine cleavage system protein GcvH [Dehalococcoidia bacterium]
MPSPNDRRYSKEHEWLKQEGELAYIGITEYAQEQLGDVVYVDLPEVGSQVIQYEKLGEIESVKAVSELYAPASGEVVMVNDEVMQKPELVNTDPHEAGWLLQIKLTRTLELNGLMSAQ